jgi:hypothetical protein
MPVNAARRASLLLIEHDLSIGIQRYEPGDVGSNLAWRAEYQVLGPYHAALCVGCVNLFDH